MKYSEVFYYIKSLYKYVLIWYMKCGIMNLDKLKFVGETIMKKFILSITILVCGILLCCSTITAEGLIQCGNNAGKQVYNGTLFSSNSPGLSIILLCIGIFLFLLGLALSIYYSRNDKNK